MRWLTNFIRIPECQEYKDSGLYFLIGGRARWSIVFYVAWTFCRILMGSENGKGSNIIFKNDLSLLLNQIFHLMFNKPDCINLFSERLRFMKIAIKIKWHFHNWSSLFAAEICYPPQLAIEGVCTSWPIYWTKGINEITLLQVGYIC